MVEALTEGVIAVCSASLTECVTVLCSAMLTVLFHCVVICVHGPCSASLCVF